MQLRVYNGQSEPVDICPEDIAIAFGYAPLSPGPWATADRLEPFTLPPGQAVDLTLHWTWAGKPYAVARVGAYRYAVELE